MKPSHAGKHWSIAALAIKLMLPSGSATAEPFPNELFALERNQPRIEKIFHWAGHIVVQTGNFFFDLDLTEGRATPIYFVGERSLVSATTAIGKPYVMARDGVLFHQSGKRDWDMIEIPEAKPNDRDGGCLLVGDAKRLVSLGRRSFKIYDGKAWTAHPYSEEFSPKSGDPCALWKDQLFLGKDEGEFGGGLHMLDLSSGKWTKLNDRRISDIQKAPDGTLWITSGLSHLGGIDGEIASIKDSGIVDQVLVSNLDESTDSWPFEATAFQAVQFTQQGDPIVLSPGLGILTLRENEWKRLTPGWDRHVYLSAFLRIDESRYVIGTYDAGVVVIDLKNQSGKAIKLAASFYEW